MKNRWMMAALALVVAVNALVLIGVARNRAGTPDATLRLTERELAESWRSRERENSGIALELHTTDDGLPWFDAAKLRTLGFVPAEARDQAPLPRLAYVVLEFNGPAWAARLQALASRVTTVREQIAGGKATTEQLEEAQQEWERARRSESRLIPVDVGLDPVALRRRYPDAANYLITAAEVRQQYADERTPAHGYISRLLTSPIHLPARFHAALAEALRHAPEHEAPIAYRAAPPRYEVTVQFGRRFEPWVVDLRPLPAPATATP